MYTVIKLYCTRKRKKKPQLLMMIRIGHKIIQCSVKKEVRRHCLLSVTQFINQSTDVLTGVDFIN